MALPYEFLKKFKSSDMINPSINTSPVTDMITGEYVVGPDGITYLNGGACSNNAIIGGNNTQKTGWTVLNMARMLLRIHTSVVFLIDQEGTFNMKRLADFVDREIGIPGYFYAELFDQRFFYFSRKDDFDGTWTHNFFKNYCEQVKQAIKNKEDVYITTPYPDNEGGNLKILNPCMPVVDSISEMEFIKVSEHFQDEDVDAGGTQNTRDMKIGNMRRIVYEDCDTMGATCGMFQFWLAQVVDIINMTGKPLEKESVFIRQGKKLKAPKSLMRRPPIGLEIIRGSALKQGQEWMYPDPFGKDVVIDADARENPDLIYYTLTPYRNKNGSSGGNFFFIGSQSLGIQEGLTMYHAIKTNNMFGLEGSAISHACVLYPDCKVGRTTIRKKILEDRKLERALTICYQMWFMQYFWLGMDKKYRITPQELYTKIKDLGLDWDYILEHTVDYWFINPAINKKTVSTMELLKVAIGEREAYWVEKDKAAA